MTESVIDNPTYIAHVRYFFEDADLEHMLDRGLDLRTYPALKAGTTCVFQVTRPPDAFMPPELDRKWSHERHQSDETETLSRAFRRRGRAALARNRPHGRAHLGDPDRSHAARGRHGQSAGARGPVAGVAKGVSPDER